jgi:hypothetical protein
MYRDYHKNNIMKKIILDDLINNNINNVKVIKKEEIMKTVNNYRASLTKSMALIDNEYKVDTKNYKLNENLLNMGIEQILTSTTKMIEQKGIIELEAEKSNINYDIIKNFFENNYPKLISEVSNVHFKISDLIEEYPMLRFGQILVNLDIVHSEGEGYAIDPFYEEPEIMWKRIQNIN